MQEEKEIGNINQETDPETQKSLTVGENMNVIENVVEFLRDSSDMYVTFSQKRFITKIRKLAKAYPESVKILCENADGSIHARLPVRALHINLQEPRKLTEEQLERMRLNMQKLHERKKA